MREVRTETTRLSPAETAKSLPKCKNKALIIVSSLKEVKSSSLDPDSNIEGRQMVTKTEFGLRSCWDLKEIDNSRFFC